MSEEFIDEADDLWTSYKELQKFIEVNLVHDTQKSGSEFELILRKYKQNFFNLLKNSPKNSKIRDELKRGVIENLPVRGHQVLSQELLHDVIIISDMYDLNEQLVLNLLCTAQIQMQYYPGLTCGLVAIILYYDGRKSLVYSLKLLVQARTGVAWRLGISEAISRYVTEYTDNLLKNGVYQRILNLLQTLDLIKEIEILQKNKALGNPKYQRQVLDLFEDIRQCLADIIYIWSAQTGLPREPTLQLIAFLRLLKVDENASGGVDNITLTLQMALLYAFDLSVLHIREDWEEIVQILPIINDNKYFEIIASELLSKKSSWKCVGLHSLTLFAMGVCIASLRLLPKNQCYQNLIEQEDYFINTALNLKLFSFLSNIFLKNENIYKDKFYYCRMHNLFSDFILMLPGKVKELRMRADETERTLIRYSREGLDPPSNVQHFFEELLMCLGKLYSNDTLKLNLMLEYWCPIEAPAGAQINQRLAPRSVSLFQFVRLAGDMIPSSLFIPYLTMLSGLSSNVQCARHCFNLLKQNSSIQSNILSWDHFFESMQRYLNNLSQEIPPATNTIYKRRNYTKGIKKTEIDGLLAVLTIIRTVASYDDFSRTLIYENPVWSPLNVLLGLVTCAVPTSLKGALLTTLAAFSKSPEIASQMWTKLELSQILITIPTTSSYQSRGIETDLEEVESTLGEYHVTRAFLELLDVLTDAGVPRNLGFNQRKPGFDPYITYIINSIFLKFLYRMYKDPEEKWIIGKLCLKLLEKFLAQYKPSTYNTSVADCNPPPGYHIMIQLNRKSELLQLILYILDEGTNVFDMYINFPGRKHLETVTLYCLNILNIALTLQPTFFSVVSEQIPNVFLINLSKLLLGINQRSGKPDYVMKICKYIGYQDFIPYHALFATKILITLTKQSLIHTQIMNILLPYIDELQLRHGFVFCLDAEDDWKETDKLNEDNGVITLTKQYIIKLMKQCLSHSAPNLTHYLCGFDIKHDISKTVFQFPDVLTFPRTCLHALIRIINSVVDAKRSPIKPSLIELAYNMLYLFCANQKTSLPVLKFLRQSNNFFKNHIQAISFTKEFTISEINQLSWLLKILAIEQKLISSNNQIFYLKQLTKLIVGFPIVIDGDTKNTDDLEMIQNLATTRNNMLTKLITVFNYSLEKITTPQWEYFDNTLLDQLITKCQSQQFPRIIDVKKLHQFLNEELNNLHKLSVLSQRQLINSEIQKVLSHIIKLNKNRQRSAAIVQFTDAWRQLTQIVFLTLPADVMTIEEEQIAIIELLKTLLNKMLEYEIFSEIAIMTSATVLILMQCLKKTHINSLKRKNVTPDDTKDKLVSKNIIYANTSSLKHILHNIIEWLIISNVSAQKLRANLYGSLMQFLLMINSGFESKRHYLKNSFYVLQMDNVNNADNIVFTANVLTNFGDKLLETVCHDCIGGHDICKMLAMSSLNMLIKLNLQPNWMTFLSAKGYLKYLVDSVLNSDRDLKLIMDSHPQTLRSLYLYETKMSLILRMATSRCGAELLLDARILTCLARMEIFNDHPTIEKYNPESSSYIIPVHVRYQQILSPALHICNVLLTSLGTDNAVAVAQVLGFLLTHLNTVEIILQQGSSNVATEFLQELAIVTGIFARTVNNDLSTIFEYADVNIKDQSYIKRIQRLMLALLPHFILSENSIKNLYAGGAVTEQLESDRLKYFMNIASNLVLYAQGLTAGSDENRKNIIMIFQPTLNDPIMSSVIGRQNSHYIKHTPTIGILIQQLLQCVQYYHKEKVNLDILKIKVATIPNMNSIDLKEFVVDPIKNYDIFMIREQAFDVVSKRLKSKQTEIDFTVFIIELCLYLIWAHLEYYMTKSKLKTTEINVFKNNLSCYEKYTWKVTEEDVISLQQELVSIFNDSFTRQLVEITQGFTALDKGFVEGLLRRIKGLIRFLPNDNDIIRSH